MVSLSKAMQSQQNPADDPHPPLQLPQPGYVFGSGIKRSYRHPATDFVMLFHEDRNVK